MLRYIGQGAAIVGVPARNLTDEEVKRFGKKRLLKTGLYVPVRAVRPKDKEPDEQANPADEREKE